jgi:hypothetical protein
LPADAAASRAAALVRRTQIETLASLAFLRRLPSAQFLAGRAGIISARERWRGTPPHQPARCQRSTCTLRVQHSSSFVIITTT